MNIVGKLVITISGHNDFPIAVLYLCMNTWMFGRKFSKKNFQKNLKILKLPGKCLNDKSS